MRDLLNMTCEWLCGAHLHSNVWMKMVFCMSCYHEKKKCLRKIDVDMFFKVWSAHRTLFVWSQLFKAASTQTDMSTGYQYNLEWIVQANGTLICNLLCHRFDFYFFQFIFKSCGFTWACWWTTYPKQCEE